MLKIFALEGLDKTGKTTFKNYIMQKYNIISMRPPIPSKDIQINYLLSSNFIKQVSIPYYLCLYSFLFHLKKSRKDNYIIFDRFLGSLYAYEYANWKNNTKYSKKLKKDIGKLIKLYNKSFDIDYIFFAVDIDKNYLKRIKNTEDGNLDKSYYKLVNKGYKKFFDIFDPNWWILDSDKMLNNKNAYEGFWNIITGHI